MKPSLRPVVGVRAPHAPGVLVAVAGFLACAASAVFLIPPLVVAPVVIVWALVYGYTDGVTGRWPWWVMGQWLSLVVVFAVTLLVSGLGLPTLWVAPSLAVFVTAVWMVPVGLVAGHRAFWSTNRPAATVDTNTATS